PHVSFPDYPGASQIVVPASLLTAPQNPQEPQQEGRKTNHCEPAQKSPPIRHSALFCTHHSKPQQPLPDSLSFDTMKNHKKDRCQTTPCPGKQHKKARATSPGQSPPMPRQPSPEPDITHIEHYRRKRQNNDAIKQECTSAAKKPAPTNFWYR